MSDIPTNLKYTKNHEWLRIDSDNEATVGITDHAQSSLGDITFVELPSIGTHLNQEESFGVIESVKAASDVYMPISGEIISINESLDSNPETLNSDPYNESWLIKIKLSDNSQLDSLLSDSQYKEII